MESKPDPLVRGILLLWLSLFLPVFEQPPAKEALIYVPAAQVLEYFDLQHRLALGAGMLEVYHGEKRIAFFIGSSEVFLRGRVVRLPNVVVLENGEVLLPSEAVDLIMRSLLGKSPRWTYEGGVFAAAGKGRPGALPPIPAHRERRQLERSIQNDIQTLVIDPGHGGKDPGGIGIGGIKEKDIVLGVSKEVQKELKRQLGGKEVILTRDRDEYLSLEARGERANSLGPEKNPIFISIHANVSYESRSRGYESYFLSLEAADESAREVASMENSVLSFEMNNYNSYIREIINRLVDVEYRRESMVLAELIQSRLGNHLGEGTVDRGIKSAFFYVLKAVKMPSVLVEIGFVTNREEASKLVRGDYQKTIAKGVAEGIVDFVTLFRKSEGFTK